LLAALRTLLTAEEAWVRTPLTPEEACVRTPLTAEEATPPTELKPFEATLPTELKPEAAEDITCGVEGRLVIALSVGRGFGVSLYIFQGRKEGGKEGTMV